MAALWEYAHSHTPHDFGRLIAADQDWLGACRYAGIGLGTGSGYSWHDRNVVLWVWTDAVDMTVARRTIMDLIDSLVPPTTTTTTTTTTITLPPPAEPGPEPLVTQASAPSVAAVTMSASPAVVAPPTLSGAAVRPGVQATAPQGARSPAAAKSPAVAKPPRKSAAPRKPASKRKPSARTNSQRAARGLGVQRG